MGDNLCKCCKTPLGHDGGITMRHLTCTYSYYDLHRECYRCGLKLIRDKNNINNWYPDEDFKTSEKDDQLYCEHCYEILHPKVVDLEERIEALEEQVKKLIEEVYRLGCR